MKILKISLIVIVSMVLIGGAGYLYASSGIKSKPGYANLATPSFNTLFSVNVGPGGLGPVRWLLERATDNSEHAQEMPKQLLKMVMQDLQGVQLRIYDVGNNRQAFDNAIAESVAALKRKNWQTLMTVRESDEQVVVLQYGGGEQIAGLSIMVSTPDNAMFLNLIGPFDPQAIVETANQINF